MNISQQNGLVAKKPQQYPHKPQPPPPPQVTNTSCSKLGTDSEIEDKEEKAEPMDFCELVMSESVCPPHPPKKRRNNHSLVRDGATLEENHQPSDASLGMHFETITPLNQSIVRFLDKSKGSWKLKNQIPE